MPDDPVGEDVLDRAEVKLAFPGPVFGDVGQPDLVRGRGGEVMAGPSLFVQNLEEIVVNRRARPAGLALLPGMASLNATDPAKPVDPVLRTDDPFVFELIRKEPVAERGVVFVEVDQLVDQVSVINITPADRLFEPFVITLGREPKDPARHRDRHPDSGTGRSHLTDERVDHFPGRFAWER